MNGNFSNLGCGRKGCNKCGGCGNDFFPVPVGPYCPVNPPAVEKGFADVRSAGVSRGNGGGASNSVLRGLAYADFYAQMPSNNPTTIAAGTDINFPEDGATSCTDIRRISSSAFNLGSAGVYLIMFDVCVEEEGQLMLTLNGTDLNYTVAGRAAAASQISGMNIIETTSPNSIITVRNPLGNPDPLTISPSVGGERPVTAHLIIIKLI